MRIFYNLFIELAHWLLPFGKFLGPKIKLFSEGRAEVFKKLQAEIEPKKKYIWIHAASLGEFEQAVPIIEMLKKNFSEHKILVTFFSPSGYENKKQHPLADIITYLPLDTKTHAKRFLKITNPELVFFVKYDVWPNFMAELKRRKIRSFLISATFRKDQIYFKSYGKWMKKALQSFEHIFVQNRDSEDLLKTQGFKNVSLSGDTRFDRVSRQLAYNNTLENVETFLQDNLCLVAGSTWPEDEALLLEYINSSPENVKFIIAPHEIKLEKIANFRSKLKLPSILYSEISEKDPVKAKALIIDNIGLLSKIYSYAHIAYVGGAAGTTGLHNILEPATFGVPIIIGKNHDKFPEAIALQKLEGLYSVESSKELAEIMNRLVKDEDFRNKTGKISGDFIIKNTGATRIIEEFLLK